MERVPGSKGRGWLSDIIICRCEGVRLHQILSSIEDGANSIQGIKKRCRVGMGYCQGRTCQPVIREVLINKLGSNPIERTSKIQSPIRPVLFRDL